MWKNVLLTRVKWSTASQRILCKRYSTKSRNSYDPCTYKIHYTIEQLIKEECYKNLEETSVPYGYVFVDELPVNLGGKIDGRAIKAASEIDLMKNDRIPKKELFFKG